jgi:hypothetical protein
MATGKKDITSIINNLYTMERNEKNEDYSFALLFAINRLEEEEWLKEAKDEIVYTDMAKLNFDREIVDIEKKIVSLARFMDVDVSVIEKLIGLKLLNSAREVHMEREYDSYDQALDYIDKRLSNSFQKKVYGWGD